MTKTIAINGRFLAQPLSGVQRFAWETIRAMDRIRRDEPGHEGSGLRMELLCPPAICPLPRLFTIPVRPVGHLGGYAWEQVELPLAARGSLVLNLCNLGPVLACKVTAIHDTIVWQMPQNYTPAFVAAYRVLLPLIARTSRHCVTVSEFSKRSLIRLGITGATPLTVIHNGVDHMLEDIEPQPEQSVAWPDRFVFALGNAAPNKNAALVRAIAPRLRGMGIATVLAGGGNASVFAGAGGGDGGVLALGRVSDTVIREGFRRALAFVFPSFHEGFGIPPLEAMALGCPVVASQTSAMPEILGEAALLRDPHVPEQWLDAIAAIATDPRLRNRLVQEGCARASLYTWDQSARRMLSLLAATARK